MSSLSVRQPLVDLTTPFERHWLQGDPLRTAFFNALSMSFPAGEQFFINSLRAAQKVLPPEKSAALETEIRGFVGQEAHASPNPCAIQ